MLCVFTNNDIKVLCKITKMNFFAYKSYTLKTNLTPEEIKLILLKNITTSKNVHISFFEDDTNTQRYEGKIYDDRFKISRIISGRNSFLPVIEGRIFKASSGAEIHIQMRLVVYTYIVWFVIMGFLLSSLFEITNLMILRNQFSFGSLIVLFFLIFCYLFCILIFNWEIGKSKKFLKDLFIK